MIKKMIRVSFGDEVKFSDTYARSTKKDVKNIRCFPNCCESGHRQSSYCGRQVSCQVVCDYDITKNLDLIAYCEIRCVNDIDSDSVSVGKTYSYAHVLEQSRSTTTKSGNGTGCSTSSWSPGIVTKFETNPASSEVRTTFSFNSKNKVWNFATLSKRQQKYELHVFILAGSKHLPTCSCICELSSSAFELKTNKKRAKSAPATAVLGKRSASQISSVAGEQAGPALGPTSPKRSSTDVAMVSATIMPTNRSTSLPSADPDASVDPVSITNAERATSLIQAPRPLSQVISRVPSVAGVESATDLLKMLQACKQQLQVGILQREGEMLKREGEMLNLVDSRQAEAV
jgi:hypothetical protein